MIARDTLGAEANRQSPRSGSASEAECALASGTWYDGQRPGGNGGCQVPTPILLHPATLIAVIPHFATYVLLLPHFHTYTHSQAADAEPEPAVHSS